eukprot:1392233-Pyramimonas_sp.AAC.1
MSGLLLLRGYGGVGRALMRDYLVGKRWTKDTRRLVSSCARTPTLSDSGGRRSFAEIRSTRANGQGLFSPRCQRVWPSIFSARGPWQ